MSELDKATIDFITDPNELRFHAENPIEEDGRIHVTPELLFAVADKIDGLRAELARRDEELERERDNYGKLFTALEDIYDALGLDDHTGSCIPEIDKLHAELARRDLELSVEQAQVKHLDGIIARLKEDAERLAKVNLYDIEIYNQCPFCFTDLEYENTVHQVDCPITIHRALMKELEND